MPLLHATDQLPLSGLGQLGAVGSVLAILLTFGWIVYKRERDRADSEATEVARLNDKIISEFVPALLAATNAVTEVHRLLDYHRDTPPPRRAR